LAGCNFPLRHELPTPTVEGATRTPFLPLTPSPEPQDTLEPSETPDARTYFEKYVYPALYTVAEERREEKAQEDPDFWHRVDRELNTNRVNFVILGLGSEGLLTDSMQVLSLDITKGEIRVIAVPRGVSAPEVSRYEGVVSTHMANQAHIHGGMPLTERMLEDATGLSCDFAMLVDMEFLSRAVENVFGNGLEVCIPWEIDDVNMGYFPAGLQTLNGDEILAVSRARYYGTYFNRDSVQQFVLKAMLRRARTEFTSGTLNAASFLTNALIFFEREQREGSMETNFNPSLIFNLAGQLVREIATGGAGGEASGFGMPVFCARYEFSTENNWDSDNTTRRRPIGGNPDANDLVADYWFSSRSEVKDFLGGVISGTGFEQESEICGLSE